MSPHTPITAVLIIKANSERVRGKNFRILADRPLFRWPIDTLLSIESVERIVINTDACGHLRAAGLSSDPRIVLDTRKPALCGDAVTANALLADILPRFEAKSYLMTHATSPFLTAASISAARSKLANNPGYDTLHSVNRFQTRFDGADGRPINHDPSKLLPTQLLETWYEENSALYLFSAESFAATGSRIGLRPLRFATPRWESVDIDDEDDWLLADLVAKGLTGTRGKTAS
ncbi:MAG: CMP-N-acetylneuraminic acid synthetase [Myxococcota bacterium]|jgi:CMP-N-acetylneuraminic acid synthetase